MVPVLDPWARDEQGFSMCFLSILSKLSPYLDSQISTDTSLRLLPSGCVRSGGVIVYRVVTTKPSVDSNLGHQQVKSGSNRQFLTIFRCDPSGRNLS